MDAHLFRAFCRAACPLLAGSRLEKIREPLPGLLSLTFRKAGEKRQLLLHSGRKDPFCFFSSARLNAGRVPSAAIMRLRKHAAGRKIAACVPHDFGRRLWLLLEGGPAAPPEKTGAERLLVWLLLDMREGASLHFLEESRCPQEEQVCWPEPEHLAQALDSWRDWPVLTPALRRALRHLEEAEQWALLEDLRLGGGDVFAYHLEGQASLQKAGPVRAIFCWPLPGEAQRALLEGAGEGARIREARGQDVLALAERAGHDLVLARLAADAARDAARPLGRRRRKLERLLHKLAEEENRLEGMLVGQANGLALQAELWRWPVDFRAESVRVGQANGLPEREIALDKRLTVRQCMLRFFHQARRGRRGLECLRQRRALLENELAALESALPVEVAAPPGGKSASRPAAQGEAAVSWPRGVQVFVSSDGFVLLRGRDSGGNRTVRRLAAPHDIWLHVENGPGAHVVIRRAHGVQDVPARTLDEAGCLAACKSWQKDAARARVQYAEARHVRALRNAPAGTVRIDSTLFSREVFVDASLEEKLAQKPPEKSGGKE